jgi:hypothetical protein
MCPKKKSDQVITHRIEFQDTERDALEMVAASIAARNVTASAENLTKGVGNLLTPILSASAAGVAAGLGLLAWWELESLQRDKMSVGGYPQGTYDEAHGLTPEQTAEKQQRRTNFRMKLNQFRNAISTELMKLSNNDLV